MAVSTIYAFSLSGLRPGRMRDPYTGGDLLYYYSQAAGVLDHGWYLHNDELGWPFGQDMRRFPAFDQLHLFLIKLLGYATSDPILAVNLYIVLGFPLAAVMAYLFFRVVGVGRMLSAPLAVSYAILPAHVLRIQHVFLAAYWVVPVGMTIVYLVASGKFDGLPGSRRFRVWAGAAGAAVGGLLAMSGVYYSLMLDFLIVVAFLLAGRPWRRLSLWPVGGMLGGTLAVAVVSRLQAAAATGPLDTSQGFNRVPGESERYGGKIAHLLLPWDGAPLVGDVRKTYSEKSVVTFGEGESTAHGIVAVAGTWILLVLVLYWLMRRPTATPALRSGPIAWLAGVHLFLVFAFVSTGFGALVALALPEVRAWNRYSIFIALVATAAVGLVVQGALRSVLQRASATTARTRTASVAVATTLGLLVAFDQGRAEPNQDLVDLTAASAASARTTLRDVAQTVQPSDCPMLQWPAFRYPEVRPQGSVGDYQQLSSYLYGGGRPLSYGGLKGSLAGEWPTWLEDGQAATLTKQAASAGFCVLEVLEGAVIRAEQRKVFRQLAEAAGPAVARDDLNQRSYFDLRGVRSELLRSEGEAGLDRIREGTLYPVLGYLEGNNAAQPDGAYAWTTRAASSLDVVNPSDQERWVTVTTSLVSPFGPATVRFGERVVDVHRTPVPVSMSIRVAPHSVSRIPIVTNFAGQKMVGSTFYVQVGVVAFAYDRGPLDEP